MPTRQDDVENRNKVYFIRQFNITHKCNQNQLDILPKGIAEALVIFATGSLIGRSQDRGFNQGIQILETLKFDRENEINCELGTIFQTRIG